MGTTAAIAADEEREEQTACRAGAHERLPRSAFPPAGPSRCPGSCWLPVRRTWAAPPRAIPTTPQPAPSAPARRRSRPWRRTRRTRTPPPLPTRSARKGAVPRCRTTRRGCKDRPTRAVGGRRRSARTRPAAVATAKETIAAAAHRHRRGDAPGCQSHRSSSLVVDSPDAVGVVVGVVGPGLHEDGHGADCKDHLPPDHEVLCTDAAAVPTNTPDSASGRVRGRAPASHCREEVTGVWRLGGPSHGRRGSARTRDDACPGMRPSPPAPRRSCSRATWRPRPVAGCRRVRRRPR